MRVSDSAKVSSIMKWRSHARVSRVVFRLSNLKKRDEDADFRCGVIERESVQAGFPESPDSVSHPTQASVIQV